MTFDTENHKETILALYIKMTGFTGTGLEEACILKHALINAKVTGEKPKKVTITEVV